MLDMEFDYIVHISVKPKNKKERLIIIYNDNLLSSLKDASIISSDATINNPFLLDEIPYENFLEYLEDTTFKGYFTVFNGRYNRMMNS